MFNRILLCLALLCSAAGQAFAALPERYDVSRAWFKPNLVVDNNTALCGALLQEYTDHFSAPAPGPDPLVMARGQAANAETVSSSSSVTALSWRSLESDRSDLRVAEWQGGGRTLAVVERESWIGWRGPFYSYVLLETGFSDSGIDESNVIEYFRENDLQALAPGEYDPNRFEVVTKSDPRRDYKANTSVVLRNVFTHDEKLFLSTAGRGWSNYLIFEVEDARHLELQCQLQVRPTRTQLVEQKERLPEYALFRDVLDDIMGGAGSCGTLNSHSRASSQLHAALRTAYFRPWARASSYLHDAEEELAFLIQSLEQWGYSGVWNHGKYLAFLELLPKALAELSGYFQANYALTRPAAEELARLTLGDALLAGFDHGSVADPDHNLHKMLLDGINRDELESFAYDPARDKAHGDSLLTFAIKDPGALAVLLEKGFDPNKANTFGKTPLMYAAQFSRLDSARLLVEHGALLELTTVEPPDNCGYTIRTKGVSALHYAVRYASAEFIEWLVSQGAPTFVEDSNGHTPADYLTTFGGMAGYRKQAATSYGEQNPRLTPDDRLRLAELLTPPDATQRVKLSNVENLRAEALYGEGKVAASYASLRRALALDANNDKALSNMSLVALKAGRLGEAAQAATSVIETTNSDREKASAYFNLGLACKEARRDPTSGPEISHDGKRYCYVGWREYLGPLHFFLEAYAVEPNEQRRDAILALFEVDPLDPKRLCRAKEQGAGVRGIYISGSYVNFLVRTDSGLSYQSVSRGYGRSIEVLEIKERETILLGGDYTLVRWKVEQAGLGSLIFGEDVCSRVFGELYQADTRLIELYTTRALDEPVRIETEVDRPTVLVLYGNYTRWQSGDSMQNIVGVYVAGRGSSFQDEKDTGIDVHEEHARVYKDPLNSSFNQNTLTDIGLSINRMIEVDSPRIVVRDGSSQ